MNATSYYRIHSNSLSVLVKYSIGLMTHQKIGNLILNLNRPLTAKLRLATESIINYELNANYIIAYANLAKALGLRGVLLGQILAIFI